MPGEIVEHQAAAIALEDLKKEASNKSYNTVFERILRKAGNDDGSISVVVCVSYYLYKFQKRDWIVQEETKRGCHIPQSEVDTYVSGWTDVRIESEIARAVQILTEFADGVTDLAVEEIEDQVYKGQFEKLHDILVQHDKNADSRHESMQSHVKSRTKAKWGAPIGQGLIVSVIWTAIVIVVVLGSSIGFDFSDFPARVRAFQHPNHNSTDLPK